MSIPQDAQKIIGEKTKNINDLGCVHQYLGCVQQLLGPHLAGPNHYQDVGCGLFSYAHGTVTHGLVNFKAGNLYW